MVKSFAMKVFFRILPSFKLLKSWIQINSDQYSYLLLKKLRILHGYEYYFIICGSNALHQKTHSFAQKIIYPIKNGLQLV